MIINCIAVDDEPLALDLIARFIEQTPFFNLMGKYSTAIEALHDIEKLSPDLIFLDIQMPELNGMELAKILTEEITAPKVIFTTAYNHFALDSYKVNALDYLLKPFNYQEFLRAANKVKRIISLFRENLDPILSNENDSNFLFLKVEQQWQKVALSEVTYLESYKDYVKVYLSGEAAPILTLNTLKALEKKLPKNQFMRVHRSFIIALNKISAVTKTAVNIGNITIQIGDQYKDDFRNFISKWI